MSRILYKSVRNVFILISTIAVITLVFPLANAESVPDCVKNTAGWWADDTISETEFVNAISYLIKII